MGRVPLWAGPLADRRGEQYRDLLPEPDQAPPPEPAVRPTGTWWLAGAWVVALLAMALGVSVAGRASFTSDEVPSAWGDVPMRCQTVRIERLGQAAELFHCRALGGSTLPAGHYASPDSLWMSDLTREPALADGILITPDGRLSGWALYQ